MNRAMLGRMVLRAASPLPPGTALIAVADDLTDAASAVQAGADLVDLGSAPASVIGQFRAAHPDVPVCADGPPANVVRTASATLPASTTLICPDVESAQASGHPAALLLVAALPAQVPAIVQAGLSALVDVDHAASLAAPSPTPPASTTQAIHNTQATCTPPATHTSPASCTTAPATSPPATTPPATHAPPASCTTAPATRPATPATSPPTASPATATSGPDAGTDAGIVALAALSAWLGARAVRTRHPAQVRQALDMTASIQGQRPPARTVRGLA